MTKVQSQTTLAEPQVHYTLSYGMRLDKVTTPNPGLCRHPMPCRTDRPAG